MSQQVAVHNNTDEIPTFLTTLARHGKQLVRTQVTTLQVNVGLLCNQVCRHCHLDAGPGRHENMDRDTMAQVAAFAREHSFELIDITGGAPEMNPYLADFLAMLSGLAPRILLRSNLTALAEKNREDLLDLMVAEKIGIVASFPSVNENQADSQRGSGVFRESIAMLQKLNERGYGCEGTSLELNLVANPAGAFLPPPEGESEKRCKRVLHERFGITFNRLFNFANMPVGRFKKWLEVSGNYNAYMKKLVDSFNPDSIDGLMCRSLISVSWDGYLYDCDFNQAVGIPMSGDRVHISDVSDLPSPGTPIAVDEHCYTCTAGSGFT